MNQTLTALVALAFIAFVVWWLATPSKATSSGKPDAAPQGGGGGGDIIDPSDDYQIGLIMGMTVGSIADAAVDHTLSSLKLPPRIRTWQKAKFSQ